MPVPPPNDRKPGSGRAGVFDFEIIEHPADVGFLAYGATLEELFANAALAMLSLGCELVGVEERERRNIEATGANTEALLYAWLAEILAIADAEHLVFRRVEVTELVAPAGPESSTGPGALGQSRVRGIAYGERFDKARHRAGTYIKAVTYHQLRVEQAPDVRGWRAQVFLDV